MKTKKEILECNLKEIPKVLQFDNLSISQLAGTNDHIFYKILNVIKSNQVIITDDTNSSLEIYSMTEKEPENDRALKIFKELQIEKYLEKSLRELKETDDKDVVKFSEKIIEQIKIYRTMFGTNISKKTQNVN